ncbi:MAG: DUF6273 domain-containing protein [Oscillospiraceae bacterium]|nr:DUF6273 domain-containing protein [Oscillospiraceae bacterium]
MNEYPNDAAEFFLRGGFPGGQEEASERELQYAGAEVAIEKIHKGETRNIPFGKHTWRVLSHYKLHYKNEQGECVLLLAEHSFDDCHYHALSKKVTWESSYMRQHLNTVFLNEFDAYDQEYILPTRNDNPANPWFGTDGGNDTLDRVFLLSIQEVFHYFGGSRKKVIKKSDHWIDDRHNVNRIATDYDGMAKGWWLRSPGRAGNLAACVCEDGRLWLNGWGVRCSLVSGIRPALWLNLS